MLTYTGYLDESGTHAGSPVTVIGGVMASARQWHDFEAEFNRMKATHGFRIFHTTKFKARRGDFEGWTDAQMLALLQDMAALTNHAFTEGVAMKLDNAAYGVEYRGGDQPKKFQPDSKYGLCFRQCLMLFVLEAEKRKQRDRWPHLHIVVESGDRNVGGAIAIFKEMKAELDEMGCDVLQTIIVADKDKCDPLMIADFIAHTTYSVEQKGITEEFRRRSAIPGPGESAITHLEFKPGGLANFKQKLAARNQARQAQPKRR